MPIGKEKEMKLIRSVQIELTNHCNFRCKFCPQAYYRNSNYSSSPFDRKKGYMTFETFKKSVEQARKFSKEINFSFFGEPTLHPEYFKFFKYLKKNRGDLNIVLNSNMSLVTKDIFELWIDTGVRQCRLSIDAASPDVYDKTRPGGLIKNLNGKFEKSRRRLDVVDEKLKYWHSLSNHSRTRHVFVVCKRNLEEIEAYIKKWAPRLNGRDEILIKNVLTYGGVINKDTPEFDSFTFNNKCNVWNQKSLTIDWKGNVTPCNLDVNMGLTIGNIFKEDLGQIFEGPKWKETRQKSVERKISPCNTCHDANNWSNNVIIKKGQKINLEHIKRFNENRPKTIPRLSNGHK
jgi:radical SAM protein with 4Fe4S-binding SPASM domain